MRDYFKFDVNFVMNITDVDDKIITRGRQQYLFKEFLKEKPSLTEKSIAVAKEAFQAYIKKNLPLLNAEAAPETFEKAVQESYGDILAGKALDGGDKPGDKEAKIKMHIRTATSAAQALASAAPTDDVAKSDIFYTNVQDVVLPHLDKLKGSTISSQNYAIFTDLTKR
ncbi:hypothetical protein KEM56_005986, partial [Ascosphaera pollenicola]